MKLTETQLRWFRLRRSGLAEPFSSPEEAARSLAGVQAQILPAVVTVYSFVTFARHVRLAVEENAVGVAQFFVLPLNDLVMDGV